jgi:uncharacterized protein YodC (DUF2158 family)
MSYMPGNAVVHKSDKKPRKMVVVAQAFKEMPPSNIHNALVNTGQVPEGSYFCTWISGTKRGEAYFTEDELELQ